MVAYHVGDGTDQVYIRLDALKSLIEDYRYEISEIKQTANFKNTFWGQYKVQQQRAEKAEREVERLTQQSANVYFNEGVDAAIAFVMGGRFLSDEAPTAQFSREVAANLPRIKRVESSPYAQKVVDGMPKPRVSDNFIQSRIYWGRAEGTGDVGIYEELQAWRAWTAERVGK